ncbi:MAG: hypothetical protein IIC64_04780 [SAR324 cluster bacterium]|nr:hypothetical protein [SAR324 cluster bacterium]
MKLRKMLPERWIFAIRALLSGNLGSPEKKEPFRGNGQSLLKLHEYQHRVIVEIFKISIAGFFGFTLILAGFSFYSLFDPHALGWISLLMVSLCFALFAGLFRTVREFRSYHRNYQELTTRLRMKLQQQTRAYQSQSEGGNPSVEHRLLSALKPKEHSGWDHKSCENCKKAIELLATVCQHCGQEQETLLVN